MAQGGVLFVRLVRSEEFADGLALHSAWLGERHASERAELAARARGLGQAELWPEPLVTSAELEQAGIPKGPRWSALLAEAETAQLDGEIVDRGSAEGWLRTRATR